MVVVNMSWNVEKLSSTVKSWMASSSLSTNSSIFDIDASNDGGCPICGSSNVAQYNNYDRYDDEDDYNDEYDD